MFKNRQILPLLLLVILTGCNSGWKPKWLSRLRPQPENRKLAEQQSEDSTDSADDSDQNQSSPAAKNSPANVATVSQSTDDELADVERHARMIRDAQNALRQHRIDEASKIYRDVLNEAPEHPDAHHGLAMAADLDEDWGDAEYHYKQALRIRPRDAVVLSDLGYSYILQNRFAEAARYLNQAIELQPSYERAHTNLALLDLKQGNRAAAEQRLVKRLGNSSQTAEILESLQQQASDSIPSPPATVANNSPAPAPTPNTTPSTPPQTNNANSTQITQNLSLLEVQEIARRERELAQQQRDERELLASTPDSLSPLTAPVAAQPNAQPNAPAPSNSPTAPRLTLAAPNSPSWPPANQPDSASNPDGRLMPQQPQHSWSSEASQTAHQVALTPPVPIRSSSNGTTTGAESYGQPAGFNRNLPSRMRITENMPSQPAPNQLSSYPRPLRTEGLNIGPGSLFPVIDNNRSQYFDPETSQNVLPVGYSQPTQPTHNQSIPGPTSATTAQYPAAWPPSARLNTTRNSSNPTAYPANAELPPQPANQPANQTPNQPTNRPLSQTPQPQPPQANNPALQPYRDQLQQINDQYNRQVLPPTYNSSPAYNPGPAFNPGQP